MGLRRIIIDTNILIAALRSRRGASNLLIQLALANNSKFEFALSVPVVLEYETVVKRQLAYLAYTQEEVDAIIGRLCQAGIMTEIFFLWRPSSRDTGDEKVLEAAIAARCDTIVTFNTINFVDARPFGMRVIKPKDFLREIGELS